MQANGLTIVTKEKAGFRKVWKETYEPNPYGIVNAMIATQPRPYREGEVSDTPVIVSGETSMLEKLPTDYWKDYFEGGSSLSEVRPDMRTPLFLKDTFSIYPPRFIPHALKLLEGNPELSYLGAGYYQGERDDMLISYPSILIQKAKSSPPKVVTVENDIPKMNTILQNPATLNQGLQSGEPITASEGLIFMLRNIANYLVDPNEQYGDDNSFNIKKLMESLIEFQSQSIDGGGDTETKKERQRQRNSHLVQGTSLFTFVARKPDGSVVLTLGDMQKCIQQGVGTILLKR